jgi:hypothetical protein
MSRQERALIETNFRAHEGGNAIAVVVATRTLSMGVNLPADVVLMWDLCNGGHEQVPLTVSEYRNFAGRAGRLRPGLPPDAFGLVILRETKNQHRHAHGLNLIVGQVSAVASQLPILHHGAAPHITASLAAHQGLIQEAPLPQRLGEVLRRTYVASQGPTELAGIHARFIEDVNRLRKRRLVDDDGLTPRGRAISSSGLSVGTLELLGDISSSWSRWRTEPLLELFFRLADTEEMNDQLRGPMTPNGGPPTKADLRRHASELYEYLMRHAEIGPAGFNFLKAVRDLSSRPAVDLAEDLELRIKATLLLKWTHGIPARRLSDFATEANQETPAYRAAIQAGKQRTLHVFGHCATGPLGDAAEMMAVLIGSLRHLLIHTMEDSESEQAQTDMLDLWIAEQTLRFGVPREQLAIAIAIAFGRNIKLRRASIGELHRAIGSPRDPRTALGVSKPMPQPGDRNRAVSDVTWRNLQDALVWWRDELPEWVKEPDEGSAVVAGLRELTKERRALPRALTAPSMSPASSVRADLVENLPVAPSDASTSGPSPAILASAAQFVSKHGRSRNDLARKIHSLLASRPLGLPLRDLARSSRDHDPIWIAAIEMRLVPIIVWPGSFRAVDLGLFREPGRAGRAVVVCGGNIDPSIAALPKGVALLIQATALIAFGEWAGHYPAHGLTVKRVLSSTGTVVRTTSDGLNLTQTAVPSP